MSAELPHTSAEPMEIVFESYDPEDERRRESLFALGNGMLVTRACASWCAERSTSAYPGTYRAGLYDRRVVYFEGAERGHDSLVNLPNWLPLSVCIINEDGYPGEPLSPRTCTVLAYRHSLDMRRGMTARQILLRDAQGRRTWLRERHLVSLSRPALAARSLDVVPENWSGRVAVRASVDGGVANANTQPGSLSPYHHLDILSAEHVTAGTLLLRARTRHSGIVVAAATRTLANGEVPRDLTDVLKAEAAHLCLTCTAAMNRALRVETTLASADGRTLRDVASACLTALEDALGFDALAEEQARAWSALWRRVGIEAAEPRLQRALAFHAFHLLQTVSPSSVDADVGLPSRGWQEAYHGQIFWDEIFTFSFLNHRFPEIARALLLYRYRRLPAARRAAREAGYAGAMYPWRSAASGEEETPSLQPNPLTSGWSPDHTRLQRHIGAAVAHDVWHYVAATGDAVFLAEYGAEMLVEIARFFASLARYDPDDDRYDIRGVIGPDEYHNAYPGASAPGLDNNAYTNVMAAACLRQARAALDRLTPERRADLVPVLGLGEEEPGNWEHIASRMRLCFLVDGVIEQFEGYRTLKSLDAKVFAAVHPEGRLDHVLEAQGDTVDAYQATKQADVLMLFYLLQPDELLGLIHSMGYSLDEQALRHTIEHYLGQISHESSLSRVVCAGALAWEDPGRSWSFFESSLMIDLDRSNSASAGEGLHLGAMAGSLDVLQRHYLGLRLRDGTLDLAPAPVPSLGLVRLRLEHRGAILQLVRNGARVSLQADAANRVTVSVRQGDHMHDLAPGETITADLGVAAINRHN